MATKEELEILIKKMQENSVSGVFELGEENMKVIRQLFDERHHIFCPTEETTFEQFCGFMVIAGINYLQQEFIKFRMKKMFSDLLEV